MPGCKNHPLLEGGSRQCIGLALFAGNLSRSKSQGPDSGITDPMHTCSSARPQGEPSADDLNHPQPPPCLVAWPPGVPFPARFGEGSDFSRIDGSPESEPDRLSE